MDSIAIITLMFNHNLIILIIEYISMNTTTTRKTTILKTVFIGETGVGKTSLIDR